MNTPWSTLPICHGPAITPQRSTDRAQPEVPRGTPSIRQLRRQLGRAVEGPRAVSGKSSEMPAPSAGQRLVGLELEARVGLPQRRPRVRRPDRRGWSRGRRTARRRGARARGSCVRRPGCCRPIAASRDACQGRGLGRALHDASTGPARQVGRSSRTSPWTKRHRPRAGAGGSAPIRAAGGCRAPRSPSRAAVRPAPRRGSRRRTRRRR